MIFKTFDGDNGFLSKIGVFNKSFAEIGKAFRDAFEKSLDFDDGIFGINTNNQGFFKNLKNNLTTQVNEVSDLYSKLFVTKTDIEPFKITDFSIYEKDSQEILNKLLATKDDVEAGEKTWQDYFGELEEGEKWQAKFVQENDLTKISLEDVDAAQNAAKQSAIAYNNGLDQMTIGAKAAKIGLDALKMAGNALTALLVTSVISIFVDMANASDEIAQSAQQIGSAFKNTVSDLDNYQVKVEELQDTINNSSSSIGDVQNARKELMSIQDEMIEKYGSEESAVKNITDAINGETKAWGNLKKTSWIDSKNEYNDTFGDGILKGIGRNLSNAFNGYKNNIDRMKKEYGDYSVDINTGSITGNENRKKVEEILSKFGTLTGSSQNSAVKQLTIEGNADDVYQTLINIQSVFEEINNESYGKNSSFVTELGNMAEAAKDVSEQYQDFWDQYVLNEEILSKGSKYTDNYKQILDDYNKYQQAVEEGDKEAAEKSKQTLIESMSGAMDEALANGDEDVVSFFQNMYPELKAEVATWRFDIDFEANTNGLKDQVEAPLKTLKGFTSDELKSDVFDLNKTTKEQQDAYNALIGVATNYGITIDELIDKLQQLGLLSSDYDKLYDKTVKRFKGKDDSSKIEDFLKSEGLTSADDVAYFNKVTEGANGATEAIKMYQAAKKQASKDYSTDSTKQYTSFVQGWADIEDPTDSRFENTRKELDELAQAGELTRKTFNKVSGAKEWAKQFKDLGLSTDILIDRINELQNSSDQLSSMKSGIKSISSVLSEKKDNLSHKKTKNVGIGADTLAGFSDDIKDLKSWKEFEKTLGDGSSSMDACRKSANKLATEWVNSNNFLSNLNETNKDYYISTLEEMGVENAASVVHQALNGYIKKQNELKAELKKENVDVANATWNEVEATNAYTAASDNAKIAIAGLYAQENILKNNDLGLNAKAEQLQEFANSALEASVAAEIANQAFHDTAMAEKGGMDTKQYQKLYNKSYIDEFNKKIKNVNKVKLKVDVNPSPVTSGSGSSGSKKKKSGDTKTKDSKEEINWIERKLTILQAKIDTTAGKIQNLFSIKAKKNNINKQLTETQNLLNANRKAAKAYQKEANKVNLSGKLKTKVRSGDYDITKYDSKTADKINKYQDYIDKAREARDAVQDNIASIHELNQQKLDNIVTWYDKLLAKINAVTSKYQAKSDLTSKIRSMLGQAETGTKTEYKNTLESQTKALKTSQKEYKDYEAERKSQRKDLVKKQNDEMSVIKANRRATKKALKQSGWSDADIKKELKRFDKVNQVNKKKRDNKAELDDFDATTKEQSAQLKETVISSLSDMIDTAQDLANIPIEKLQKTLDNLSTDFSKLENQASRASKQLEDVGIGLGYLEKVNASKISNKQTAVNNAGTTYRNAVSNRDSLATQLRTNGVDPNGIKTSDDLIKFADNTPLASLASQYLASISAVDSAFKTLNETTEDLRGTIDDVVASEVDAKNKLLDQDIEEADRQLENWKKEHSYKDNTINNVAPSAYFDTNKDVNKYSGNKINAIIYAAEHSNHADDYSMKADSYRNDANGIANWLKGIHGMYTGSLNSVFSQIEDLTANFEVIPEEILETIKKEAPDQLPNLVKYNEYWKQSSDYSKKAEDAQYTYDYETVPQMYKDIFAAISADADRTVGDIQDDIDHIENYLQDNLLTDTTDSYMQEASKYRDQADVYAKEVADKEKWLAEAEANGMVKGSDDWNTLNDEIKTAKKNQEGSSRNYTNALVNSFNSIGDIADRSIKEIDKNLSRLNSEISMLEAQGHFITSDFYDQQGDYYAQQQIANEKKASDLQADLDSLVESGDIKEYSARWYEMKDKIDDATQSALDFGVKVKKAAKSAFDATLQLGEKSREAITRMNDEADFYQDILGRDKLVDEKTGAFTSNGLASMSLSYEKMTNDIVDKNNIQKEIDKVKARYANGTNDDYGIEQYNTDMDKLLSQQREAIKNYYDERDAVMSLVEEGLNKQLEVLQDIVDKYKEAMDAASDLRDYQNSVDDATKNISSLQKQLAVVQGNDSEEGRATAQSLQKQLEDAQKDLDDLEWDKKKSDMEDILDQMMNDAQDFIDDKLDQITDSIDQIRDLLPENAQEVYNTLKDIDAKWGTQISDNLAEGVKLGDYSTILSGMDSAAAKIAQAVYDAEKAKLERNETPTPTPETPSTDNNSSNNSGSQSGQTSNDTTSSNNTGTKHNLKNFISQYLVSMDATENEQSEYRTEFDNFIHSLGFKGVIPDSKINEMLADLGDTAVISSVPLQYRIDQLKNDLQRKIELGGFSRGGIVDKINQQVRRNNDDALISVKSGEGILTPQQTAMFQKLVENMPSLVDLSKIKLPTLQSSANSSKNITVEMGDMSFNLTNVTDTDSFINAWKSDTKLKNFVADVVSGTVTGDNSKAMRY